MNRHAWKVLAFLAAVVPAAVALAMGGDHPTDHPVGGQAGWSAGLRELVNTPGRVGGFFVNASDFFYFRGDAKAFNAWLESYAALQDTPLRLVLHPGRSDDRRPWSKDGEKRLPVDWCLDVINRQWSRDAIEEKKPVKPGYDVTVHLFLGGQVGLEDLDVPLAVGVESAGEVERFVAQHQAMQTLLKTSTPAPPAEPSPRPAQAEPRPAQAEPRP